MDAHQTVGSLFKALRKAENLTQPELATKAGVAVSTISRLETGTLVPSPEKLAALAFALRCKPDDLTRVGEKRAADLLRTRQAHTVGRVSMAPDVAVAASDHPLLHAMQILTDAGWRVTLRRSDLADAMVMEIQPPEV